MDRKSLIRLGILAAVMVTLALLAAYTPLGHYFNLNYIQQLIQGAGWWGVLIYIVIFVAGTLLNIPGLLFMVTGFLVYGLGIGSLVGYTGAFLSVLAHFLLIRSIGGTPLTEIKNKTVQRIMNGFESHPLRTVIILRLLMFISPPLNYMLALSGVKLRDFVLGTLVGIIPPILFQVGMMYFAQDVLLKRFA